MQAIGSGRPVSETVRSGSGLRPSRHACSIPGIKAETFASFVAPHAASGQAEPSTSLSRGGLSAGGDQRLRKGLLDPLFSHAAASSRIARKACEVHGLLKMPKSPAASASAAVRCPVTAIAGMSKRSWISFAAAKPSLPSAKRTSTNTRSGRSRATRLISSAAVLARPTIAWPRAASSPQRYSATNQLSSAIAMRRGFISAADVHRTALPGRPR